MLRHRARSLGREFTADEVKVGSAGAAIISYGFAIRNFGEAQAALGKTLGIGGKAIAVVGVMPAGFRFPENTDVWITESIFGEETPMRGRRTTIASLLGRLKLAVEGLSMLQCKAQNADDGDRGAARGKISGLEQDEERRGHAAAGFFG